MNASAKMLAYHLDMKHAMWRPEYIDQFAGTLARWGFNTVVYEVEDKFRFRNHPAIAHADAPSHAENAAIADSLRRHGLAVIPLAQSLGHAEYVLRHGAYAHLRQTPDAVNLYDPGAEASQAMLIELFDEMIEVFRPTEYFHMGGDETYGLGQCPHHEATAAAIGVAGLYVRHMLPLWEHLHRRGLRPIIWADIVLTHPEILDQIPKYVVMMDWDYVTGGSRVQQLLCWGHDRVDMAGYRAIDDKALHARLDRFVLDEQSPRDGMFRGFAYADALRDMGLDVITASANRSSNDTNGIPRNDRHVPNVFYSARKGTQVGLGHCVTSWAVRFAHPELCLAATYAAPYALQTEGELDGQRFAAALTQDSYGVAMPQLAQAFTQAQQRLPVSEAWQWWDRSNVGREGDDLFAAYLAEADKLPGGRAQARATLQGQRENLASARATLAGMAAQAQANARNLEFWLEGVELVIFYADVLSAVLEGTVRTQAQGLLDRLGGLRANTRRLFAQTYRPQSVEEELAARYGYHEAYLAHL